jgi:hypothetical protein
MKESDDPYWKTGILRPVPAHVKSHDEVGIRRHINEEHERLGLKKPVGQLRKVPLSEVFK